MPLTKATQNVISPNICTTDTAQTITGVKTISNDTFINGLTAGKGAGNVSTNTAFGLTALATNTTGLANTAIGESALELNTLGDNNTAVGRLALQSNTIGDNNVAIGVDALDGNISGNNNVAVGVNALELNTSGIDNVAIGASALAANLTGTDNTAVGRATLLNNLANNNTAVGSGALYDNTTGYKNVAVGMVALQNNITGDDNVAIGYNALGSNTTGIQNTALGSAALNSNTGYSNTTGVGFNADVSGSNQVRIGNSSVTSVTSQTNAWSDERDKADIRDTVLGLEFVASLRPVDFKWDFREDYRPKMPVAPSTNATEEEKASYKIAKTKWAEDAKWANLVHDGTHKRTRFHHGLIAQEVKALIEQSGVDFGGFQDHTVAGGDAVMTIGYTELIGPMIKAIQELSAEVAALKAK